MCVHFLDISEKRNGTTEGDCNIGRSLRSLAGQWFSAYTGYPQKTHIVTSPSITCTTWPPTRILVTESPDLDARTKIKLGRRVSAPCSITPWVSGASTPCFTAQAVQHPAAEPVAGSSPL